MTAGWSGWAHQRLSFRRVKWPTWEEGEEYGQITGGNLELSAFSDLKVDGSLNFEGVEAPDDRDLVRVYYGYSDSTGEQPMRALATLVFSVSKPTHEGVTVSGKLECRSTLSILAGRNYGAPFAVPAGTKAVQKAVELVESLGLRTNNPDPSAYEVKGCHTFKEDEADYLTIVNWLLDAAGYSSAWVDAYGVVQMTPYVEPTARASSLSLADDAASILYPELSRESDWADTPNVVRLYYETEDESLRASASNVDPAHAASLPSRGYEVTYRETVGELAGDTRAERLENLKALARQKLVDKSSGVEYVEGKCQYVEGLAPNAAIEIDYARAGLEWRGAVTNVSVDLSAAMPAKFKARRFVRSGLEVEASASAQ